MWPTSLASVLVIFSFVACGPGKDTAEPDSGADGVGDEDADEGPTDPRDQPARQCEAGHACEVYGQSCVVGQTRCHCTSPCSGVELPPEESYPRWACREVDPKCPEDVPENGARCHPKGLRCGWGTCGGVSAVCEDRQWTVQRYGPPP